MVFPAQILIVEDERQLAENLRIFLGRRAADVRIAPDADAATAMLGSFVPDLVVLDDGLPGVDGLRAYEKILPYCPSPPRCVLLTSDLSDAVAARVLRQGSCRVLCKPFSFSDLQHAIAATSPD